MPAISVSSVTIRYSPWFGLAHRRPSSTTFDRARRVGLELLPLVGVLRQLHSEIREQARRGLAAGHLDLTDDREHLGDVERAAFHATGVRVARRQFGVEQIGQEVISWIRSPGLELADEVTLLFHDVAFEADAFVVADDAPDGGNRRVGPSTEVVTTGVGDLQDGGDGGYRQRCGEPVDEVDAGRTAEAVDQFLAHTSDLRFQPRHTPRRERHRHEPSIAGVRRRVLGEHRRHVRPTVGVHLAQAVAQFR